MSIFSIRDFTTGGDVFGADQGKTCAKVGSTPQTAGNVQDSAQVIKGFAQERFWVPQPNCRYYALARQYQPLYNTLVEGIPPVIQGKHHHFHIIMVPYPMRCSCTSTTKLPVTLGAEDRQTNSLPPQVTKTKPESEDTKTGIIKIILEMKDVAIPMIKNVAIPFIALATITCLKWYLSPTRR